MMRDPKVIERDYPDEGYTEPLAYVKELPRLSVGYEMRIRMTADEEVLFIGKARHRRDQSKATGVDIHIYTTWLLIGAGYLLLSAASGVILFVSLSAGAYYITAPSILFCVILAILGIIRIIASNAMHVKLGLNRGGNKWSRGKLAFSRLG